MKKNVAIALTAAAILIAVAVTTTLVLTLQEDQPEPELGSIVAKVNQGYLVGRVEPQAGIFWGIPFSQPPVGEYRWKNPREPIDFPGAYWNATFPRPGCIQKCTLPAEEYSCPQVQGEDCLYLNVWVPSRLLTKVEGDDVVKGEHYVVSEEYQNEDENSLAVMVWLYGGNFISGAGGVALYDGRYLSDRGNVITVDTNYRLGPLGYLVQGNGQDAAVGNYGIWDQIRALEWVQANIRYFGGNPQRVTVYGQSAGAESIGVLMTSPYVKDRGLFQQSIMQSNPFGLPFRDWDNAREFGSRFAGAAGCLEHDMDCLRKLNTNEILDAYQDSYLEVVGLEKVFLIFQPWAPVIDGDFLPEQPVDAFMRGAALDIPSIIGGTVDEGMLFVAGAFGSPVGNAGYRAAVKVIAKNRSRLVTEEYPPACPLLLPGDCDNRYVMNDVATDFLFLCPQRASLNAMKSNTWFYIFNETWSFKEIWGQPMCYDTVCHAAELPYVFNMGNLTIYHYTADEQVLANRMGWYWTNFAKYGDPNEDGSSFGESPIIEGSQVDAVEWPKFKGFAKNTSSYYALQMTAEGDFVMYEAYKEKCDFWDWIDGYGDY